MDSETETLIDSIASIDDAVDILNDLLLVDKVDSGLMRLEKKKVNVLPLVRSIYQSFVAQVLFVIASPQCLSSYRRLTANVL